MLTIRFSIANSLCRCLNQKLLTYALGRELDVGDRPSIEGILEKLDGTEGDCTTSYR